VLTFIGAVVNRYKGNSAVEIWQVENEPFLEFFGECPKITREQLQKEIDLVRSLDNRLIMITGSGELSTWYPESKMGDIFGHTLYRRVWNKYLGYWNYFFVTPSFYRVKAWLVRSVPDRTYVAELQAEPWFPHDPLTTPLEEHYKGMDAEQLRANFEFANETNAYRTYAWGVEWWYRMKTVHGDEGFWNIAREYFSK
jgi:hypothetical protein